MISRVGHRLGGGARGLVDAVPGFGGAVLRAAQRGGHGGEPGVGEQLDGGGHGGLVQPPGHVVQGVPGAGGGQEQRGEQVLGGGSPQVAAVLVGDGEHEMPGEPVGVLDGAQPVQQVPPPGLRLVGDVLRVEQPHPPAGAAARSAAVAAHRSDLLEVAITAPGADSTNGIACAVVLPDRGAMNATTVSSHDAYTAGPAAAAGAHQLAERQPGLGRVASSAGRCRRATGAAR